jgi:5-methylcytosine-specific restriction endonuclease McrA
MDEYKKKKIPKALREQLWIQKVGKKFESKCKTTWCRNKITVFDFQAGHDVPECKGGSTDLLNLVPICSRCNLSMGSQYTFKEWCKAGKGPSKWINFFQNVLPVKWNKSSDTTENGSKSRRKPTKPKGKPAK